MKRTALDELRRRRGQSMKLWVEHMQGLRGLPPESFVLISEAQRDELFKHIDEQALELAALQDSIAGQRKAS